MEASSEERCRFVDVQTLDASLHLVSKCVPTVSSLTSQTPDQFVELKPSYVKGIASLSSEVARKGVKRGKVPDILELVEENLEGIAKEGSSLMGKLSTNLRSSTSTEAQVAELISLVEKSGTWNRHEREALVEMLMDVIDIEGTLHCLEHFSSPEEAEEHKAVCRFRPQPCVNEGCVAVFSSWTSEAHDNQCPFKLLTCRLECTVPIRRMDMEEHCDTVCDMKPCVCPFESIGCGKQLVQGVLPRHLQDEVNSHLLLAVGMIQSQGALIESLREQLNDANSRAAKLISLQEGTSELVEGRMKSLAEASRKTKADTEKLVKKTSSAVEAVGTEIAGTQKDVRSLQGQMETIRQLLHPK